MKVVKHANCSSGNNLSQVGQPSHTKFAFVTPDNNTLYRITPYVRCRDFLNDVTFSHLKGNSFSQYGFCARPWMYPLCTKNGRVHLVMSGEPYELDALKQNLDYLQEFEAKANYKRTVVREVKEKEQTVLYIKGSTRWVTSPTSTSLYTLLLRVLSRDDDPEVASLWEYLKKFTNTFNDGDQSLVQHLTKNLTEHALLIFLRRVKAIYGNDLYGSSNTSWNSRVIHDNQGIIKQANYFQKADKVPDKYFGSRWAKRWKYYASL